MTPAAYRLLAFALSALALPAAAKAEPAEPTQPAAEGCAWENISDAATGLSVWGQNCDSDGRQLSFVFKDGSLYQKLSDNRFLTPVATVYAVEEGETPAEAVKLVYAEHTFDDVAARCVLSEITEEPLPEGVAHYNFVPGPELQKEVDAASSDGMPEPVCGDLGLHYDSVSTFQTVEGADKIVFLQLGNDTPQFDYLHLGFVSQAATGEEEELPPYVGKWTCGKTSISIDSAVYHDGKKDIEIQEAQEGSDSSYTLLFADDSFVTLSNFKPDGMTWLSSAGGKPRQCTRSSAE